MKNIYNTKDVICVLNNFLEENKVKNTMQYSSFSKIEVNFIVNLIFLRPKKVFFNYLINRYMDNNIDLLYLSPADLRKLDFVTNLLIPPYNAAKAAKLAGFSPKTAKQQASRLIKEIRRKIGE